MTRSWEDRFADLIAWAFRWVPVAGLVVGVTCLLAMAGRSVVAWWLA